MGFESIDQPCWSSEVERNAKMSTSFLWLERGGRWDSSSSTSPADHHKLNVMQKWAFHFMPGERWQMGFESIDQPGQWSELECNTKMSISFFCLERDGRWGLSLSTSPADHQKLTIIQKQAFHFLVGEGWQMGSQSFGQPGRSSEVEHNPKMSISFFGWRGVLDGVWVHRPAWLITWNWK